ncbi:MAG: HAD family phosphatase, partial [Candidatus Promineofilum sp.]|nr:HAD family phosphatase [Promineifilum sp.]
MIRTAVLFDMDGLMVDTEPRARAAWEQIAAAYGRTVSDDLYGRMLGVRTSESALLLRDALALPLDVDELIARKTAVFLADLDANGVPVMPGLWALLNALDARGRPWAVATSTPRDVAAHILGRMGLAGRYGALAGGDEV